MFALLVTGIVSFASASLTSDTFQAPFRVSDAKGMIDVDIGHAAPLITDFDGDGVPDLLVGQFGEGKRELDPHNLAYSRLSTV